MIINEQGVVFGLLDEETQKKLRKCEKIWVYTDTNGWYELEDPGWQPSCVYKGELKEKTTSPTSPMTPYELLGRALMSKIGSIEIITCVNLNYAYISGISASVDLWIKEGWRLVPEGMTEYDYEKCLPLTKETER